MRLVRLQVPRDRDVRYREALRLTTPRRPKRNWQASHKFLTDAMSKAEVALRAALASSVVERARVTEAQGILKAALRDYLDVLLPEDSL